MYFKLITNRDSLTLDDSITSTSTESDEILQRGIRQSSHLYYQLNITINVFLLILFFTALLSPLMTFLSGVLFKWGEYLLHFLFSLSDTLDQTLWPWLIIQFPYISSNTICILLATYFDEVIISHFYEIKACKKAAPCVDYRDESTFNTKCNFSVYPDLARKIFKATLSCCKCIFIKRNYKQLPQKLCAILSRLMFPDKLISDVPEETAAIKCTDDAPCNAIRVLSFNKPLIEVANGSAEAVRFEINKSPDTKKPLHYPYHNNDFNGQNSEEAKPSSSASDQSSTAQHLITPSQPTSSDNVHMLAKVATFNGNNTKLHKKFQPQLTQSVTQNQTVSKCHR